MELLTDTRSIEQKLFAFLVAIIPASVWLLVAVSAIWLSVPEFLVRVAGHAELRVDRATRTMAAG